MARRSKAAPKGSDEGRLKKELAWLLGTLRTGKASLPREEYDRSIEEAERAGLWELRYALEDAVFESFDPEQYAFFRAMVQQQSFEDAHVVQAIRSLVEGALKADGLLGFSIENRTKNVFGVYKKVRLKNISINNIFDLHGFRVIVKTKKDCYRAVEVLHRLWPHFPERFKDYIKYPKQNGYRSLHTVLSCLGRKPVEFQVRTYGMDIAACSGRANHAEYKKSAAATYLPFSAVFSPVRRPRPSSRKG